MSADVLESAIDFQVGGMTCSRCQGHVHRTIMGVAGVSACTVHLDTGAVRVTGAGVDATAVIAAVTAESYTCKVMESAIDFQVGGMTCSRCQGHVHRTIMGVRSEEHTSELQSL